MCGTRYLKVCLIAYLFLCLTIRSHAQHRKFPPKLLPYYHQALHYDFGSWPLVDIDTLSLEDQPAAIYINSLASILQVVIEKEDPAVNQRDRWLELLDECSSINPLCSFAQSEVIFHHSLIYFLQGEHFKSFIQFRKVYRSDIQDSQSLLSLKTSGMLNIMLGAVPEQYQWIFNLLGYRGDQILGMQQLDKLIDHDTFLSLEALMIKLLFQQYLFDQDTFGEWLELRIQYPTSPLIQFLFNANALKNHQSQYVIDRQIDSHIDQVYGQLGEAYLNKLEYDSALRYFEVYEDNLKNKATAEMTHKIWLCYQLKADSLNAAKYASKLLEIDEHISEADENAIFNLQLRQGQDMELMKVRLATDGGYYQLANSILNEIDSVSLVDSRSQVEYVYRRARLLHLTGKPSVALPYYKKVLSESPKTGWYFAPNTAYQLGMIYEKQGKLEKAIEYYEMVDNYKNYPYRSSLVNKSNLRMRIVNSKD